MTTVFSAGFENLTGHIINDLLVLNLSGRNPVRWAVKCRRCACAFVAQHTLLQNGGARCLNSPCQKAFDFRKRYSERWK